MKNLKAIILAIPILASCSNYHLNYDLLSQRTEQVLTRFPELRTDSEALTELVFKEQGLTFEKARDYDPSFNFQAVETFYQSKVSSKKANMWADFCSSRNITMKPDTIIRFEADGTDTLGKHIDRFSNYKSF